VAEYLHVTREAKQRAGDKPMSPDDIRTVFEERLERIQAARTELLEAMREDVGPAR
jgi:hypothetical protein